MPETRPAGYAGNKSTEFVWTEQKKKKKGSEEAGTRSVILLSNLEQLISFKQ